MACSITANQDPFNKKPSLCTSIIPRYLCQVAEESALKRSRYKVFKSNTPTKILPYEYPGIPATLSTYRSHISPALLSIPYLSVQVKVGRLLSLLQIRKLPVVNVRSGTFTRNKVEPRSTDTRLTRTSGYYGEFRLSRRKAHIFSVKLTRLIRTPVNTDNGHFSVSRVTNSQILSTPLYGHSVYLCTVSVFSTF